MSSAVYLYPRYEIFSIDEFKWINFSEEPKQTIYLVSIPLWCDWEGVEGSIPSGPTAVSIPSWCDWEKEQTDYPELQIKVSIPSWCDWEFECLTSSNWSTSFNSIMVRLGVNCHCRLFNSVPVSIPSWCDWEVMDLAPANFVHPEFQFHHGAIGSSFHPVFHSPLRSFNSIMVRLGEPCCRLPY